jgi:hypothetical protein
MFDPRVVPLCNPEIPMRGTPGPLYSTTPPAGVVFARTDRLCRHQPQTFGEARDSLRPF